MARMNSATSSWKKAATLACVWRHWPVRLIYLASDHSPCACCDGEACVPGRLADTTLVFSNNGWILA